MIAASSRAGWRGFSGRVLSSLGVSSKSPPAPPNPFVALSTALDDVNGQTAVFFVLVVAAAEVVVGLGIIVAILRRKPGATADDISLMRG